MKKVLFIFIALYPWLFCEGKVIALSPTPASQWICGEAEEIIGGVVRVKVVPSVELAVGVFPKGEARTGYESLDAALDSLEVTEIEKVFNEGRKFADRRRRYGLHLWYSLRIGESVTVEEAVKALSELEEIEYAGPVYRVGTSDCKVR